VEILRRYGPKPPCFARAGIAHVEAARLLIGGRQYPRRIPSISATSARRYETLRNMSALIAAAGDDTTESTPALLAPR
jgi:hypothetical protein